MKDVFFVRHGQTEWNASRRMQGQWNSNLNEHGRAHAQSHGQFLKRQGIEHLVASPLDRTRQTATIINDLLNLEVAYDDRIKEWDCGDWSGEMWDEVSLKWPDEFAAWRADEFHYRPPNSENYPDMIARATPFLHELEAMDLERVAVVSHGIIGRVMVGILLELPPEQMFSFHQPNDTIFQLTRSGDHFVTQHYVDGDGPHGGLPPRPPR